MPREDRPKLSAVPPLTREQRTADPLLVDVTLREMRDAGRDQTVQWQVAG